MNGHVWLFAAFVQAALAQMTTSLAQRCPTLENVTTVACVHQYAAVMPLPFSRSTSLNNSYNPDDRFSHTNVSDSSFTLVRNATFVVFDEERGLELLGPSPTLDFMFAGNPPEAVQEAPVYVPGLNAIIASTLAPGTIPQIIINLNGSTPSIANFTIDPPVYGVAGGRYFNGTVYWAVSGSTFTFDGERILQAPGIYALNPFTRKVAPVLNNYYGQRFNGPDDLVIDANGDIYFTDPFYAYALNFTTFLPVLHQNIYRFRPTTGAVSVVESGVSIPNGIAISPDGATLYIANTAPTNFSLTGPGSTVIPRYGWDSTVDKSLYAFDLIDSPPGKYLANKRPIWYPEEFADDGFHAAGNGYLVGASGFGVDVLSQYGELLVRIQTDFVVNNIQFAGPGLDELWLFGIGSISRVKWNLKGMSDGRS